MNQIDQNIQNKIPIFIKPKEKKTENVIDQQ